MHPMIEKARARKAAQLAAANQSKAREESFKAALQELEDREYRVSFPGYEGDDSHVLIAEDRKALQEYFDAEEGEPSMGGARVGDGLEDLKGLLDRE